MAKCWSGTVSCHAQPSKRLGGVLHGVLCIMGKGLEEFCMLSCTARKKSGWVYCMVSCTACQKVGRGIACCQAQHGKRSGGILHVVMRSMAKSR